MNHKKRRTPILGHSVELVITFQEGTGMTQLVSREYVRFTTPVQLAPRQQLAGWLLFPASDHLGETMVGFVAGVANVERLTRDRECYQVHARFDRLSFHPSPYVEPNGAESWRERGGRRSAQGSSWRA